MRTKTTRSVASIAYVERVNRAIDHITSHLAERLSLEAVSRAARLSPFHFHRVFQALMGETPSGFVKRLRLERALAMMWHSQSTRRYPLTRIAHACGFSSSSDFSRCFKQQYGVSPSRFDIARWQSKNRSTLEALVPGPNGEMTPRLERLPGGGRHSRANPDGFEVKLRALPARTVAYIRVREPYRGDAVPNATRRLLAWAERHGFADGQWLGYQWENPELVALDKCLYHVAVEAEQFDPCGEIGRYRFPSMVVAEVEIRGGIDLELRALQWLYGTWLPGSGYVPDDYPGFEAWIGRPFAHGTEHFEIRAQLPITRV